MTIQVDEEEQLRQWLVCSHSEETYLLPLVSFQHFAAEKI